MTLTPEHRNVFRNLLMNALATEAEKKKEDLLMKSNALAYKRS